MKICDFLKLWVIYQAKKEAKVALTKHGLLGKGVETKSAFKVPSSDQLSFKRVDPAKLEVLCLALCLLSML